MGYSGKQEQLDFVKYRKISHFKSEIIDSYEHATIPSVIIWFCLMKLFPILTVLCRYCFYVVSKKLNVFLLRWNCSRRCITSQNFTNLKNASDGWLWRQHRISKKGLAIMSVEVSSFTVQLHIIQDTITSTCKKSMDMWITFIDTDILKSIKMIKCIYVCNIGAKIKKSRQYGQQGLAWKIVLVLILLTHQKVEQYNCYKLRSTFVNYSCTLSMAIKYFRNEYYILIRLHSLFTITRLYSAAQKSEYFSWHNWQLSDGSYILQW